jgi:hypothetical protein
MKPLFSFFTCILFAFLFSGCKSTSGLYLSTDQLLQTDSSSAKVIPNPYYNKAGGLKRFLLGHHYRKEWATPVEVEVMNFDTTAGGLTPLKLGGGMQTKSLRLKGADGKEYVLRSVNKDPSKALPPEFRGTFANDVLQDQISSSFPYAALVVAELAKAADIYQISPRIVYVPNSPRLGQFQKELGNTLCLFEERPVGEQDDNPNFDFSEKVVTSEKMLAKVFGDNDHRMDEKFFLKNRLFDIVIGDWDRHEDQWLWATFKTDDDLTLYKPIPRDRDQAFPKLDGLVPKIAARKWVVRKTQSFEHKIRDINGFNMNGINLDKNFTIGLTLNDWLTMADSLQLSLTDAKIEQAFKTLPVSIYNVSAKKLISRLKARRNDLKKYAETYYRFINKEVNIVGTDDTEYFEVNRLNGDSTRVVVHKINKKGERENILLNRTFYTSETKEIRLYGLGDADQFNVTGETEGGILVRIIGGSGVDQYTDSSVVHGKANATRIYDSLGNVFNTSRETKRIYTSDTLLVDYKRRNFKYDKLVPRFTPGYNYDDGIYVGGGFTLTKQKFGKQPYGFTQTVAGNYAFETGAFNFWFDRILNRAFGKWDLHLAAEINAPNFVFNYFGLGNETVLIEKSRNFNRVRSEQYNLAAGVVRTFNNKFTWDFNLGYQHIEVEKTPDRFVSDPRAKIDSTLFSAKQFGFVQLGYMIDNTNNPLYPTKGIRLLTSFGINQNLKDKEQNFPYMHFNVSGYASAGNITFAVRSGLSTIFSNEYEFYQANTLGGTTNLRGYRRTRFSGRTSLYENAEVRWKLGTTNLYLIKGNIGLLGFADGGRVWIPTESSDKWHWGYGGGFWILPYNKLALTVTYGISEEDQLVNIRAGFLF